ncbi:MAG: hypothetical protein ACRDXX_13135 [Stackebrandtia sp.]
MTETCRGCGAAVMRVDDPETGTCATLDALVVPVNADLNAADLIFERHPREGWHCLALNRRRGFPLHYLHTCKRETNERTQ